jgi:hypothetical protein
MKEREVPSGGEEYNLIRRKSDPLIYSPGADEFEWQIVFGLGQDLERGNTKKCDQGIDDNRKNTMRNA